MRVSKKEAAIFIIISVILLSAAVFAFAGKFSGWAYYDTKSNSLAVTVSPPNPKAGDAVSITASVSSSTAIGSIRIYVDYALKTVCFAKTCRYTSKSLSLGNHSYYAIAYGPKNFMSPLATFRIQPVAPAVDVSGIKVSQECTGLSCTCAQRGGVCKPSSENFPYWASDDYTECKPNSRCSFTNTYPLKCSGNIDDNFDVNNGKLVLGSKIGNSYRTATAVERALLGCDGKKAIIAKDSCSGTVIKNCIVKGYAFSFPPPIAYLYDRFFSSTASKNEDCSISSPENGIYYACIDKNGDGKYGGPGEQSSPVVISEDKTPPVLFNIAASAVSNSANITWMTDENSSTCVFYWRTSLYSTNGMWACNSKQTSVKSHSITLTGLIPSTLYNYKPFSMDAGWNQDPYRLPGYYMTSGSKQFKTLASDLATRVNKTY
jgi:hypothetical protein